MSPPRFLVDSLAADSVIVLGAEESVHAARVLRLGVGSHVELFDGRGNAATAEIVSEARRQVAVRVCGPLLPPRPTLLAIGLCVSLPRGERQQQLVEIASQLAVSLLVPMVTERSVHQPSEKGHTRLQRWAVESAKQCRRNDLLTICPPADGNRLLSPSGGRLELTTNDGVASAWDLPPGARGWIAHPGTAPLAARGDGPACAVHSGTSPPHRGNAETLPLGSLASGAAAGEIVPTPLSPVWLAIGPEGGFSDSEFELAINAGWQPLNLGPHILRVETAVAVAVTVVRQQLEPDYFGRPPQVSMRSVCSG